MRQRRAILLLAIFVQPALLAVAGWAAQTGIIDILANPARFWNLKVTVVGQVQTVQAVPEGTTKGYYQLLDDTGPTALTVRSNELPLVGRSYAVTGVVIQDPTKPNIPVLKESSRSSPGGGSGTLVILVVAVLVLAGLAVTFLVVLKRPRPAAGAAARPAPGAAKTVKVPAAAPAAGDKTQVFMNLGADLVVERGPDKGKEFPLYKPQMSIGRPGSRKNDVELGDETVSKDQASISYDAVRKTFTIVNESSTNPTRVNGEVVAAPLLLAPGAEIEMGRTLLRFKKS